MLCHGLGADGYDLIDLAPTWANALPDAAFVAPDAPDRCDLGPTGRQWWSVADRSPPVVEAGVRRAFGPTIRVNGLRGSVVLRNDLKFSNLIDSNIHATQRSKP